MSLDSIAKLSTRSHALRGNAVAPRLRCETRRVSTAFPRSAWERETCFGLLMRCATHFQSNQFLHRLG